MKVTLALFLAGTASTMKISKLHNHQYFATGMNGDEDLAEDITMKGDKFHYLQKQSGEYPVGGGYNDSIDEIDWANHHKTTLDSYHGNNKVDTLFPGRFTTES